MFSKQNRNKAAFTGVQDSGILDTKAKSKPASPVRSIMVESSLASDREPLTKEEKRLTKSVERGSPGDAAIFSLDKTPEQKEAAKRKSQYYSDVFGRRESNTSARERILRESIVVAEVRTNVIVKDEFAFITDLSYNLSSRYQRPESSILVTLTHSLCLLLGGSFDPAYTLTITALPSQVQPVTNKRNAMLLTKLLEESLSVPASRGVVKFVGVQEENFAVNGRTAAAEIEDLDKEQADDNANIKRRLSRLAPTKRQSTLSMRNLKAEFVSHSNITAMEPLPPNLEGSERLTPPQSESGTPPPAVSTLPLPMPTQFSQTQTAPMPTAPIRKTVLDRRVGNAQKIGRKKSFISGLFGR